MNMFTKLFRKTELNEEIPKTINNAEIMSENLKNLQEKFSKLNLVFNNENLKNWQKQWKNRSLFCEKNKTSTIQSTICSNNPSITNIISDLMNWLKNDINYIQARLDGSMEKPDIEHFVNGMNFMGLYVMLTLFLIQNDNIFDTLPISDTKYILDNLYENYRMLIGCTGEDNSYSYKFINIYNENRQQILDYYQKDQPSDADDIIKYLDNINKILTDQCAYLLTKLL